MDIDMKPIKCIIVGAGATGSMVACFLKRLYGNRLSLQLWDKGRGAGGRMSTSRYGNNSSLSLDLGAQYISVTKDYQTKHASIHDELIKNNILSPLTGPIEGMRGDEDTVHYVTPCGINTIPKYFLKQSGSPSTFQMTVNTVNMNDSKLVVHAKKGQDAFQEDADAIIMTIPIPQLLNIKGDISTCLDPCRTKLQKVSYSSRFALGLFYENSSDIANTLWVSRYVKNNPCLCFISFDSRKREDSVGGCSIVAHSSVPFGIKHLEENLEDIEKIMLDYLQKELPGLPKADKTKVIRWRYSQVRDGYEGNPGNIVINNSPLLICAGDGFSHSNLDGCIESAQSVVEQFKTRFPLV